MRTTVLLVLLILAGGLWLLLWKGESGDVSGLAEVHVGADGRDAKLPAGSPASEVTTTPFSDAQLERRLPGAQISGTVVDSRLRPIPGASIKGVVTTLAGDHLSKTYSTIAQAGGTFRMLLPADAAVLTLAVSAMGFAPNVLALVPVGSDDVRVVLTGGFTLGGSVRDGSGAPVMGATLVWWSLGMAKAFGGRVVSDIRGEFTATHVSPSIYLTCRADGYSQRTLRLDNQAVGRRVEIVLLKPIQLTGRVQGKLDGIVLADLPVELWSVEGYIGHGFGPFHSIKRLASATTDAEGAFVLTGVPGINEQAPQYGGEGAHLAVLIPPADAYAPLWLRVPTADHGVVNVGTVELFPRAGIVGRVVDPDGRGIGGLSVMYSQSRISVFRTMQKWGVNPFRFYRYPAFPPLSWIMATTDAAGYYKMGTIPAAADQAPGHLLIMPPLMRPWATRVTPTPGETIQAPDIQVDMDPGARLFGRVIGLEDGQPVRGARVEGGSSELFTDASGRFEMKLFPGTPQPRAGLFISRRGYRHANVAREEGTTSESPQTITMQRAASKLSGSVIDSESVPVPGALIRVFDGRVDASQALAYSGAASQSWLYAVTKTRFDGTFSVAHLPKGPYHVVAAYPAYVPGAAHASKEGIPSASKGLQIQFDVAFGIEIESASHLVRFVSSRTGEAIEFLKVPRLKTKRGKTVLARHRRGGAFVFENVESGAVTIRINDLGRGPMVFKNVLLDREVTELMVRDEVSVSGAIERTNVAASADIVLDMVDVVTGSVVTSTAVTANRFVITDLPPGNYRIGLAPQFRTRLRIDGGPLHDLTVKKGTSPVHLVLRVLPR